MPSIVTSKFRVRNATQFIEGLSEVAGASTTAYDGVSFIYMFIGKVLSWDTTHAGYSDSVIPAPDGDYQTLDSEPWRDMIALERISTDDLTLGGVRNDWASGTVYTQYDDQDPNVAKALSPFFVYEPNSGNVFKCIDNNSGAPSTVEPTKPGAAVRWEVFETSDGYRWKYMTTIPAGTASVFLTDNYIPLRTMNLHPDDTGVSGFEDQKTVQENANAGTMEAYVVVSGGSGYTAHSGAISTKTIDGGTFTPNSTFFQLSSDPATTAFIDDHLNGAAIRVSNTTYVKGISTIADYGTLYETGTGNQPRCVQLDDEMAAPNVPVAGDTFTIGPNVLVEGDSTNANAYSLCSSSGSVIAVRTHAAGNGYNYANVTVVQPENLSGSGAQIRAIMPPAGGHGFHTTNELNAFNVIMAKTLNGAGTGNTFPIANDYRVIGLVRNPILADGYNGVIETPATDGANWFANTTPLRQVTWIVANTTDLMSTGDDAWTPVADEEVIGNTSGATARVVEYNTDGRGILSLVNVTTNTSGLGFMSSEQIGRLQDAQGVPSVPTSVYITANAASDPHVEDPAEETLREPELQPYTGEILYLEYRTPIVRSSEQAEEISIVTEF